MFQNTIKWKILLIIIAPTLVLACQREDIGFKPESDANGTINTMGIEAEESEAGTSSDNIEGDDKARDGTATAKEDGGTEATD